MKWGGIGREQVSRGSWVRCNQIGVALNEILLKTFSRNITRVIKVVEYSHILEYTSLQSILKSIYTDKYKSAIILHNVTLSRTFIRGN